LSNPLEFFSEIGTNLPYNILTNRKIAATQQPV